MFENERHGQMLSDSSSSLGSSLLEEDTASPLSDSDKPMTDSQDPVLLTPFCTVRPPPTESLMSQSTSDDVFLRPQHSKSKLEQSLSDIFPITLAL